MPQRGHFALCLLVRTLDAFEPSPPSSPAPPSLPGTCGAGGIPADLQSSLAAGDSGAVTGCFVFADTEAVSYADEFAAWWNNSYRIPNAVPNSTNLAGSLVYSGSNLVVNDIAAVAADASGTDFDVTWYYTNANLATFLIRATEEHTYVLTQHQKLLTFRSTDTSLMPASVYENVGTWNRDGGYLLGGYCADERLGLVACSDSRNIVWCLQRDLNSIS